MLGFIAAISAEFASHKGLLQQYRMAPGPIAVVFLLFTVASLIPISKVRPFYGSRTRSFQPLGAHGLHESVAHPASFCSVT